MGPKAEPSVLNATWNIFEGEPRLLRIASVYAEASGEACSFGSCHSDATEMVDLSLMCVPMVKFCGFFAFLRPSRALAASEWAFFEDGAWNCRICVIVILAVLGDGKAKMLLL